MGRPACPGAYSVLPTGLTRRPAKTAMIHIFHGDDTFTIQEQLSQLRQGIGPEEVWEANTSVLPGLHFTPAQLLGACGAVPFLAAQRLVLVQGLLARFGAQEDRRARRDSPRKEMPTEWQGLGRQLQQLPTSTVLVFVEPALDPANPLLALLRPLSQVKEFPFLPRGELVQWVRERARGKHLELAPQATQLLVDMIGPDLWSMNNTLDQLALFCTGRVAGRQDVEALASHVREASIFEAVDAALAGDVGQATQLLHRLLDGGAGSGYLIAMLGRQVRLLLLAQELLQQRLPDEEVGHRLGIRAGFPLRKTLGQARGISYARLVGMHARLLDADVAIKTGVLEETLALETLVAELCLRG
ncbi:MAG: DNA polymerase III subunit delta [Chloroflexi bacterium]|nr:DNA polymerase III subunit delta [Chloroflexota bacterium]